MKPGTANRSAGTGGSARPLRRWTLGRLMLLPLLYPLALAGCHTGVEPGTPFVLQTRAIEGAGIPAVGTDSTLDVATWNLEWFGDPGNGPVDDALQQANVAAVIAALELDLWSVQEVTDARAFDRLVDRLDGYAGILADDPRVAEGPAYYSDFGGNEMKVGLIYRSDMVTVDSARVILTAHDRAFAGRPPVELRLTVRPRTAGTPIDLVAILLHAKAGADPEDRERREAGAVALKAYLDATHPDARVLVIGDLNDDVDTSIAAGHPSPYRAFVADTAGYRFVTAALSAAGTSSTVFWPEVIDHHLVSDELAADVVGEPARLTGGDYLPGYGDTTSDHYPIIARYAPWTAGGAPVTIEPLRRVELGWVGATSDQVEIFRDGELVARTVNDGQYTDAAPAGQPRLVYRVCEPASDRCSNQATVTLR